MPTYRGTLARMGKSHAIVSMPYRILNRARALVGTAWGGLDPVPVAGDSRCATLVRVMCRMFASRGRMDFERGYVQALQERMAAAGMTVPHSHSIRWYRSALQENPARFLCTPGVEPDLIEAIEDRYLA